MKGMKSQEKFIQTIIKDYWSFVLNTLSSPTFFGGSISRIAVGWYSSLCHGNTNTLSSSSLTLCSIITATSCYITALIKSEQPLLPQKVSYGLLSRSWNILFTMGRRHDFLAQTAQQLYRVCKNCDKRTPHVCIKCGFCYSCHWKIEGTELNQLQPLVAATTTV